MKDDIDIRCEERNFIRLPYIEWNEKGKIINISKSLAKKCGYKSERAFLREFKQIKDFLHYPDWKSVTLDLKKNSRIEDFPLCVRGSNRDSNSSLMMLTAELGISDDDNYDAVIKIESGEGDFDKSIIEKSLEGIFVSTPHGKFLRVNPKLVEIYGYDSIEEMEQLNDIALEIYHKPKVRQQLMDRLENGQVIENFQFIGKRKDGRLILVSKNVHPVCKQNRLLFLYGYVKDISESTKDIDSPIPTFKCDFDGHIFHANQALADLLGYYRQEILNINIKALYSKPHERKDWLEQLKKQGKLHNSPRYLKNKNGELIKVFVNVVISTDIIGNPLYIKGWLSNEPGGDVKLSWIESLKKHLSAKEQELALGIIKKMAREKSITDDFPEEEIYQIAHSIQDIIRTNTHFEKEQSSSLLSSLTDKEYSLEEKIELDIWHSLEFFSRRREILQDALKMSQVIILLDTSEEDVFQKIKNKMLLGIDCNGEYLFPAWQFNLKKSDGLVDKLSTILTALEMPDIAKLSWLVSPNKILGGRKPSSILRNGSPEDKKKVAEEAYGVGRC